MICRYCCGTGKVNGIGYVKEECPKCDGLGKILKSAAIDQAATINETDAIKKIMKETGCTEAEAKNALGQAITSSEKTHESKESDAVETHQHQHVAESAHQTRGKKAAAKASKEA